MTCYVTLCPHTCVDDLWVDLKRVLDPKKTFDFVRDVFLKSEFHKVVRNGPFGVHFGVVLGGSLALS